ncbi:MAG: M42 family metallopeptidase [Oscillospiraceae bacterium]|nr:M42 family metallopeptidase [Oscillospiraceae bacterium]
MNTFNLIAKLTAIHGPSGRENAVAQAIAEIAKPYADDITIDTLGNVIVHKRGNGPKLMFAAHMDSIGLIVSYIEEDGSLRVGRVGGVRPSAIMNMPVRFANGTLGTVRAHGKADANNLTIDDLYLDIGAANRADAQSRVQIGDVAVYGTTAFQTGNCIVTPYLDNRVSCAVQLLALERLKENTNDLYFVFTVQEEIGGRGAKTSSYSIDPDFGVALDVTIAADTPGAKRVCSVDMGKGAAIKVMDGSLVAHPKMVERMTALAKEKNIKHQLEVLTAGGTDAGQIHQSRNGVVSGVISIPCRYVHTPTEMADLDDIENCVALTVALSECDLSKGM